MSNRVSKQQIKEWTDNPVTIALKWLCMRELNNTRSVTAGDCLLRGDPQKTQEQLIEQATKENEWAAFLNLVNGYWKYQLGDLENFSKLVEEYDEDSDEDQSGPE